MVGEIVESISVLLVDDDVTCLNIVAGLLKSLKYKVVAVKHPIEALFALRVRAGSFDLVITDVHMPDMNGFELQKKIEEEFNLPVVFMSSDDEESVIVRGLQSGGVFFLVKPISSYDLKNLWQYAVAKKKPKSAIIEEIGSTQESSKADKQAINEINHSPSENEKGSNDAVWSKTSLQNDDWKSTNDFKRKSPENVEEGEDDEYDDSDKSKKTKVWTDELHLKFLEAVKSTGVERAVPKTILELMNVPGLKRVQVASHLQKYRLFLKKVAETAEANFKIQSPSETNKVERTFTNNKFASSAPNSKQPLIGNAIGIAKPLYQQADPSANSTPLFGSGHSKQPLIGNAKPRHQQANPSANWTPLFGSGQSRPLLNETNSKQMLIGNAKPLYQQANPSANWTPLFGSSQSRSLLSQTNFNQPLIGNAKPFYQQANTCAFRMGSYDQPSGSLPSRKGSISGGIMNGSLRNGTGNISGGIMNGTTFMQPYQQKDQVTPESCANGPITGYGNAKDFANCNLNPRPNHQNSSSYAGLRIASDGRLVGFNLNSGLINELQRKRTSNAPILNGYSGDYLGQGEPFVRFQNGSIVPPTFDDAIQDDDDTLVMPRLPVLSGNSGDYFGQGPSIGSLSGSTSVMPLSPAILQANTFRNEKESDHISGLLDNESSNNVFGFDDSDLNFLQSYCEGSFNIPDDINIVQPYGEGSSNIPDDINIIQPCGKDSFNIPDDINIFQPCGEDTINIPDNINIIQPYGKGSFNTQHDVGALNSAFSFNPDDHVKNNPILLNNDQALGQPSGGEMIFSNFDIDGVDEYFPAFDQTIDRFPPQLDQESLDFLDGIINPRGS